MPLAKINSNKLSTLTTLLFIFITLLLALTGCTFKHKSKALQHDQEIVAVEAVKVTPKQRKSKIETQGELQSEETAVITSEVKGKIIYLNIPEGKEVKKGHILAKIEDATQLANIKTKEANFEHAKEKFQRIENLYNEGAVSKQTLDDAKENLKDAEGQLDNVKSEHTKTILYAPFNGVLSLKKASIGTFIDPGDEIVRISKIKPLSLIFTLPEKFISEIKKGGKVNFQVESSIEKQYQAEITAIDPYIDPQSRKFNVKARILSSDNELLPGRFAKIWLETTHSKDIIYIPEEAIVPEQDKHYVYIVSPKNKALKKEIQIGEYDEKEVEVISGLQSGDIVITSGHQKVQDGTKVSVQVASNIKNKYLSKE